MTTPDRNLLVPVALARIERHHGPVNRRRVWVIGDAPLDSAGADHLVEDLTDTAAILTLLA